MVVPRIIEEKGVVLAGMDLAVRMKQQGAGLRTTPLDNYGRG